MNSSVKRLRKNGGKQMRKTIKQCECEKKFCWMAEFCRSPRKSVRLEKQNVTVAVGGDAVS